MSIVTSENSKEASYTESHQWSRELRSYKTRQLVLGSEGQKKKSNKWSSYESFSFVVVAWLWGAMIVVIAGLHFFNYDKETITSSTSSTHSGFHEIRN